MYLMLRMEVKETIIINQYSSTNLIIKRHRQWDPKQSLGGRDLASVVGITAQIVWPCYNNTHRQHQGRVTLFCV